VTSGVPGKVTGPDGKPLSGQDKIRFEARKAAARGGRIEQANVGVEAARQTSDFAMAVAEQAQQKLAELEAREAFRQRQQHEAEVQRYQQERAAEALRPGNRQVSGTNLWESSPDHDPRVDQAMAEVRDWGDENAAMAHVAIVRQQVAAEYTRRQHDRRMRIEEGGTGLAAPPGAGSFAYDAIPGMPSSAGVPIALAGQGHQVRDDGVIVVVPAPLEETALEETALEEKTPEQAAAEQQERVRQEIAADYADRVARTPPWMRARGVLAPSRNAAVPPGLSSRTMTTYNPGSAPLGSEPVPARQNQQAGNQLDRGLGALAMSATGPANWTTEETA
jgi:hypothetical protein